MTYCAPRLMDVSGSFHFVLSIKSGSDSVLGESVGQQSITGRMNIPSHAHSRGAALANAKTQRQSLHCAIRLKVRTIRARGAGGDTVSQECTRLLQDVRCHMHKFAACAWWHMTTHLGSLCMDEEALGKQSRDSDRRICCIAAGVGVCKVSTCKPAPDGYDWDRQVNSDRTDWRWQPTSTNRLLPEGVCIAGGVVGGSNTALTVTRTTGMSELHGLWGTCTCKLTPD